MRADAHTPPLLALVAGISLFFRLQLPNTVHKKSKFGVTLTEDNCIEKDYSVRCPGGWKDKGDGWCLPPKYYQVQPNAVHLLYGVH